MLCFRMPVWNFDVQATKTRHSWTWNLINSTCQIKLYTMHLVLIYEISWSKLQGITPNLLLIFFVRNRLKKQPQEVFLEVLLLLWYPYLSYHVITTFFRIIGHFSGWGLQWCGCTKELMFKTKLFFATFLKYVINRYFCLSAATDVFHLARKFLFTFHLKDDEKV